MTERRQLTDDSVSSLQTPGSGESRVWDLTLKGFCVRIHPSERKVFCLKHMVDGRSRWTTLGVFRSPWTEMSQTQPFAPARPNSPQGRSLPLDPGPKADAITKSAKGRIADKWAQRRIVLAA
jgi:hypothetical protein